MSAPNSFKLIDIHEKEIKLSKNGIDFLESQFAREFEKKMINEKFIFQIIYVMKKYSNWYNCSLIDLNKKYDGFFIKYEDESLIPKMGDIIETRSIQIVKLPNRDNYIFFCDKVRKINENLDLMKINLQKINRYDENNINMEYIQNININKINKFITPNKNKNNIVFENDDYNKKYTLIKDLSTEKNLDDIIFYVKCRKKCAIKEYNNKSEKADGKFQYYIFIDSEGDTMRVTAFSMININYFNNIIQSGSVYEISNLTIQKSKGEYSEISPFTFVITKNSKIRKLEDKGDFNKIKVIYDKIKIKICDLNSSKLHIGINIIGIILENKGIVETPFSENKYRLLIIGDNTLHKIHLKLWSNKINEDRVFSVGDIIYMTSFYYNEYPVYCELSNSKISEVYLCHQSPMEQELKEFYKAHPNVYEYKDMNLLYLNTKKDIPIKFASDIKNANKKENDNLAKNKCIKLFGTITNFIHRASNVASICSFCDKKVDDSHFFICCGIPKLSFKLFIEIKDCSGHIYSDLYGKIAEEFLKMSPEEYINIINNNNEEKLREIDKRILYKNYIFYGKYIPSGPYNVFSILKCGEINGNLYKNLIQALAYNFD